MIGGLRRSFYITGLLLSALPVFAGEYAILASGLRLHTDRHEASGEKVRLFTGDGVTEMPAALIDRFEQDDYVEPPAPQPIKPAEAPAAAVISPRATPHELAHAAAEQFSLPAGFVAGVMKAESAYRANALSPKGAMGLMQLMPQTARELGVDPSDPRANANGGAHYLHELLVRYQDRPDQVLLALAAYNAGPAAVERWHGVPPYRETREYILRVLRNWREHEAGTNP